MQVHSPLHDTHYMMMKTYFLLFFAALSATKPLKVIVIEEGMERTCLFRDHFHKTQRTHHFSRTSQEYENCKQKKPSLSHKLLLATFFSIYFTRRKFLKVFQSIMERSRMWYLLSKIGNSCVT